jgi:hypothetical protein
VAGFVCNYLVEPLADDWFMKPEEVGKLHAASAASDAAIPHGSFGIGKGGLEGKVVLFWLVVGIPLAWGVWKTLESAIKIF